jgi:hypothetical protein
MAWRWELKDTGELVKKTQSSPKQSKTKIVRAVKPPKITTPKEYPKHGTYTRYTSPYKCRCDNCRKAYNKYTSQNRKSKFERLGDNVEHGKYTTYVGWCCRCVLCSDAMREYQNKRREHANKLVKENKLKKKLDKTKII